MPAVPPPPCANPPPPPSAPAAVGEDRHPGGHVWPDLQRDSAQPGVPAAAGHGHRQWQEDAAAVSEPKRSGWEGCSGSIPLVGPAVAQAIPGRPSLCRQATPFYMQASYLKGAALPRGLQRQQGPAGQAPQTRGGAGCIAPVPCGPRPGRPPACPADSRRWKHGVRSALNAFPMFNKTGAVRDGEVVWRLDEASLQQEQEAQAAVRPAAAGPRGGGGGCSTWRVSWPNSLPCPVSASNLGQAQCCA